MAGEPLAYALIYAAGGFPVLPPRSLSTTDVTDRTGAETASPSGRTATAPGRPIPTGAGAMSITGRRPSTSAQTPTLARPAYRGAMRTLEERRRRLAVARAASQIELLIGGVACVLPALLWLSAPTFSQPMWTPEKNSVAGVPVDALFMLAGTVVMLTAYASMLWIQLHDHEAHDSHWWSGL
jgi:hypothetical protein